MNPKRLLSQTILIGFILFHLPASAQPPATGPQVIEAIQAYTGSLAADWRLYNGPLYLGYDRHAQGHPFFLSDSLLQGSAEYDGIFFPSLGLSYDLVKDLVIIPDKQRSAWLQLLSEKLTIFTIGQHSFIYLAPDSTVSNQPEKGFYELLYSGKARAFARHRKKVLNVGKAEENLSRYYQYEDWYLEMDNRFIAIHNQKSLLHAFGAGDKGLKAVLHSNNLNFKKDPAAAMIAAAKLLSR